MTNKKKAYLVKSQEAYDKLMKELEEKGYLWRYGEKPTETDVDLYHISDYADGMCIYLEGKKFLTVAFNFSENTIPTTIT